MLIANKHIYPMLGFLDSMNLKGRESLGRTKLKTKLEPKSEIFGKDQEEIINEFDGWVDRDAGRFTTDNKEMNEALSEFYKEEVEIVYNSPFRKDFEKALENYEGDLEGINADMYAILYEQLVEEKTTEEENK